MQYPDRESSDQERWQSLVAGLLHVSPGRTTGQRHRTLDSPLPLAEEVAARVPPEGELSGWDCCQPPHKKNGVEPNYRFDAALGRLRDVSGDQSSFAATKRLVLLGPF